jgi:hypothetical protein
MRAVSQSYPMDERHWLLGTAYNTGTECLQSVFNPIFPTTSPQLNSFHASLAHRYLTKRRDGSKPLLAFADLFQVARNVLRRCVSACELRMVFVRGTIAHFFAVPIAQDFGYLHAPPFTLWRQALKFLVLQAFHALTCPGFYDSDVLSSVLWSSRVLALPAHETGSYRGLCCNVYLSYRSIL